MSDDTALFIAYVALGISAGSVVWLLWNVLFWRPPR